MSSYPLFTLASYTYYYRPSLQRILQAFNGDPISLHFQHQTCHLCPFEQILALSLLASVTMSNPSAPIFISSCSTSPVNNAGNTPYIVTSPPLDSLTSSELTLPHKQMIEHIARLLNIEEEEVCRQFPSNHSLLPIDISPPCHHIPISDTLLLYPGTEFANVTDPSYPNSPPSSPEPLPIPPPHKTMICASPFDDWCMAVILYDKLAAQEALIQA